MAIYVVLLRAIGPITHKIMSMAQWRQAVAAAGLINPETFLATGNMIVESADDIDEVSQQMNAVAKAVGLPTTCCAVVRKPDQLRRLLQVDPFPEASRTRPEQFGVYFFAEAGPNFDWLKDYQGVEKIHVEHQHLIVDYNGGVSKSRLPIMIERKTGVATARNWNTLRGLVERCDRRALQGH